MNHTPNTIRTRFAPSPTGFVHIGSLRTALFSFLYARHNNGVHVLRIEDTDQNRLVEGAAENLIKVMKKLGVEFDEGLYLKEDGTTGERGEYGPYLQSQRLDLYKKYADELIANGKAYYCFCSAERLDALRKEQMALKKPAMYDRHCYKLSADEVARQQAEFKASGKNPVVRFLIPEGQTVVHDLIFGNITYQHSVLDDQVLLKSDGFPTYHLAVVVDDHFMEISHVIRGDEWIPSTPKHILLYQALGWEPTEFAHLPLILNPDKTKLSKRQGDVAVEDFLDKGYLPEALLNFVAFLGWNPKTEQELFSLNDLIKEFDLKNVNKSGAVFDLNKLDWINGQYIKQMPDAQLADKLSIFWMKDQMIRLREGDKVEFFNGQTAPNSYLIAIAGLEKERLKKLSEIGERTGYFFTAPKYEANLLVWKKADAKDAKQKLSELIVLLNSLEDEKLNTTDLEFEIKNFISTNSYDTGAVLWPMRTALTGMEKSPGPFEVCATLALGLGKTEVISRLQAAADKLA